MKYKDFFIIRECLEAKYCILEHKFTIKYISIHFIRASHISDRSFASRYNRSLTAGKTRNPISLIMCVHIGLRFRAEWASRARARVVEGEEEEKRRERGWRDGGRLRGFHEIYNSYRHCANI